MPTSLLRLSVATATLLAAPLAAQSSQTLPAGLLNGDGNAGTPFPFVDNYDQALQYHYDDMQFVAAQPILITEVYVRSAFALNSIVPFQVADLELVMASSPTTFVSGNHSVIFEENLGPNRSQVRSGPYNAPGAGPLQWMALELDHPFPYDPTAGRDFVLQLRKCGQVQGGNAYIDSESALTSALGGNTYMDTWGCNGTQSSTQMLYAVPVIRIDYVLLPGIPALTLLGNCGQPGSGIAVSNCTPGAQVALGWSTALAPTAIASAPCGSTMVALDAPALVGGRIADANGDAAFLPAGGIPAAACGVVRLQALDLATCIPSPVLSL